MSNKKCFRGAAILFLTIAAAASAGGCSTFSPRKLDVLHLFTSRRPKPPAEGEPAYTVVLLPNGAQAEAFQMPLDEPVTVSEAMEQSGAMREFARREIFLERTIPGEGRSHRMEIHYDRVHQAITPDTDYAIYPGDRLIVKEDSSGLLDDSLETISSAMNLYGG